MDDASYDPPGYQIHMMRRNIKLVGVHRWGQEILDYEQILLFLTRATLG